MAPQQAKAGKAEISGTERADVPPGTYARGPGEARADGPLRPIHAQPPAHLVFVHEGVRIAAGDAGFVGEPVGALFAAQEGRARFEAVKPLSEATAGHGRDAGDQAAVQVR